MLLYLLMVNQLNQKELKNKSVDFIIGSAFSPLRRPPLGDFAEATG